MRKMEWGVVVTLCVVWVATAGAQGNVQHEANFDAERKQANELYLKNDKLQALPLYEDLARQDPTVAVFAERMGSGLIAAADIESDPAKKAALHDRSMAAFREAKRLGDDSPLVETMLGMEEDRQRAIAAAAKSKPAISAPPVNPLSSNPEAVAWMEKGETAFAMNDTATAFEDYKKASEIDPKSYMAKLYTGDACFRKGDFACAGEWFGKAIALEPNRETAYRYWGDALYKSGHSLEAKEKYEQAILAEPYSRLSWGGLSQWAQVMKIGMSSPPIQRPTVTRDGNGVKVALPALLAKATPTDVEAWTGYGACRAKSDKPGQRRTVDSEVVCLKAAADLAAKEIAAGKVTQEALTPGTQALIRLDHEQMLGCWVVLNGADQETAQDYVVYRTANRELLLAYLNQEVLHPNEVSTGRSHLQVNP